MLYIFGYGSLLNAKSREKTLPGERLIRPAVLQGYQRKINAPVNGFLYLNIIPNPAMRVEGALIEISSAELPEIKRREAGYDCVDISGKVAGDDRSTILTFIAPDRTWPGLRVPRSYLNTCLRAIPEPLREQWLKETIIENEIQEDTNRPVYVNAA